MTILETIAENEKILKSFVNFIPFAPNTSIESLAKEIIRLNKKIEILKSRPIKKAILSNSQNVYFITEKSKLIN
jgi:hypothetical protein